MASPKKKLTSAVEGYTVAQVRKCLAEMRTAWQNNSACEPYSPHKMTSCDMSFSLFSFAFVKGHHEKRQKKRSQ